jgi:glycerol kinase
VIWDRASGEPIANAIVWQCRRTAALVEELCGDEAVVRLIRSKTGLIPDAYFSASKIRWLLDNVPGARARAERGELAFVTVDSWLIWQLTGGAVHATDVTNASRTMLFDIHRGVWDEELLELFGVPAALLPEVRPSSADYGVTAHPSIPAGIPIRGVVGDQQAALFGQCCFEPGQAKNTYGTGCFLLMNTGTVACESHNQLVTTIAASAPAGVGVGSTGRGADGGVDVDAGGEVDRPVRLEYALEGSVFVAGALIQWLRDELGLLSTAAQSQKLARSVEDSAGVYIVPAFTGLGAPWWDAEARGAIYGLTRGARREHLVRAALESLAYQVNDLVTAVVADAGVPLSELRVDGAASRNDFLMQFQTDILGVPVVRSANTEATALGAAFLAGLNTGFWSDTNELRSLIGKGTQFMPALAADRRATLLAGWHDAIRRTRS